MIEQVSKAMPSTVYARAESERVLGTRLFFMLVLVAVDALVLILIMTGLSELEYGARIPGALGTLGARDRLQFARCISIWRLRFAATAFVYSHTGSDGCRDRLGIGNDLGGWLRVEIGGT